jgi:glutamyl-tRNA synthetase
MNDDGRRLADLLFPEVSLRPEDIKRRYPPRKLPQGAMVTRFAPSPTGKLHIGHLYAALLYERLAHQSGGPVLLRIEDTDQKRRHPGSVAEIIQSLAAFGIRFDEGLLDENTETGAYGPYVQSRRQEIYQVFVKDLVRQGAAYPCFCTEAELARIRQVQTERGERTGYYGSWAGHRNRPLTEIRAELAAGKGFAVRLKSPGAAGCRISFHDLVKGEITMPENDQDIVILKSDGLPTYHFAHALDDQLMGTTHVFRGDEWLPSVPLHLQLFAVLGFEPPRYGHIGPLLKMDGNSKRKFSKRKDPDGAVEYYREQGYLLPALLEYFLTLLNSDFENWRAAHPELPDTVFPVRINRLNPAGALFDLNKLNDLSKNRIASFDAATAYQEAFAWAREYDPELAGLMQGHRDYALRILNIGRNREKPRKDLTKWSDLRAYMGYFYDELFDRAGNGAASGLYPVAVEASREIIRHYIRIFNPGDDPAAWFGRIRELAEELGYAGDVKTARAYPGRYRGSAADVAMVLRLALTGKTATPDLYEIMQVMGTERVLGRLRRACCP